MSSERAKVFVCDGCRQPGQRAGYVLLGDSLEGVVAGQRGRWEYCFACLDIALHLRVEKAAADPNATTLLKVEGEGQ